MVTASLRLALAVVLLASGPACAGDLKFSGFGEARLVAHDGPPSWLDGGLGKLRYGQGNAAAQFGEITGRADWQIGSALHATATARIEQAQRSGVDVLEAYLRYRPVSTSRWQWSLKAGAFFPPVSLENTEIGWTSYWTLTPSAINSWVGQELRAIGAEARLDWRGDRDTVGVNGALFGWNDPAGVMIADPGWTLLDRVTGLFDHLRQPDVHGRVTGDTPPIYTPLFMEIDHRIGWYAGASWTRKGFGQLSLLYYDNNADPAAEKNEIYGWRTKFWSAGAKTTWRRFTVLAQAMRGSTVIEPAPHFTITTDFDSAYLLLGWEKGRWRLAARGDLFATWQHVRTNPAKLNERGHALTGAVSFLPRDWLKLTGEVLHIDSRRPERVLARQPERQKATQAQLSLRAYF